MLRTRKKKAKREGDQNPVVVHTKRTQIVDEEGWTHVVDKPQRTTTKPKAALHAGDFEINGVSYIEKTADDLKRDYDFWLKQWKEAAASKELEKILEENRTKLSEVDNFVVLGLGSMQSARREGRRSSATQLAALQTVINVLGSTNAVFQDPQYTDLDGKFLESFGYTVVNDPDAFGTINEKTLVFAVHCYKEVYGAVAARENKPAAFIGTDIANFGRFDTSNAAESICVSLENLVEGCEALDFPQIVGRHDFSDTKIYWRKSVATKEDSNIEPYDEAPTTSEEERKLADPDTVLSNHENASKPEDPKLAKVMHDIASDPEESANKNDIKKPGLDESVVSEVSD